MFGSQVQNGEKKGFCKLLQYFFFFLFLVSLVFSNLSNAIFLKENLNYSRYFRSFIMKFTCGHRVALYVHM